MNLKSEFCLYFETDGVFVCMMLVLILLCLFVSIGMSYGALPEAHSVEALFGLRAC